MLAHDGLQQLREAPELMRAEDEIHDAVGSLQLLGHVRLLGHAAADGDDLVGVFGLRVVQRAHVSEHALLGVLPHGAGVEDDEIRLVFVLCEAEAHRLEIAAQLLAVGLVLLAAVGVHQRERRTFLLLIKRAETPADIQLLRDALRRDFGSFVSHS